MAGTGTWIKPRYDPARPLVWVGSGYGAFIPAGGARRLASSRAGGAHRKTRAPRDAGADLDVVPEQLDGAANDE